MAAPTFPVASRILRRPLSRLACLTAAAWLAAPVAPGSVCPVSAGEADDEAETVFEPTGEWTVLHQSHEGTARPRPIPEESPLKPLHGFELIGPRPNDPFLLGKVTTKGSWALARGRLQPIKAPETALKIARAEDFEMQGIFELNGYGGWFILLGWKDGHGYGVYNPRLIESGSPWIFCEFRSAKALDSPHREFHRFEWKGAKPFRLQVVDAKLTIQVGKRTVARELPLPRYHKGDVIIGTYKTDYGPRGVRIRSLRIRAR